MSKYVEATVPHNQDFALACPLYCTVQKYDRGSIALFNFSFHSMLVLACLHILLYLIIDEWLKGVEGTVVLYTRLATNWLLSRRR